jgi:CRP/FNR family cyclic AMP-dependent transcriptional regulator
VKKIVAIVSEEKGCPLYHAGDGMEFVTPAVAGLNYTPVCMKAVQTFASPLVKLQQGASPSSFQNVHCGGCREGEAWFSFRKEEAERGHSLSPEAARFALTGLTQVKIFSGVRPRLLERILPLLRERKCEPGEIVIHAGEAGQALCIIAQGHFDVVKETAGERTVIATLETGDCFGEMSLVTGEPASAEVLSRGVGSILEIHRDDFPRLVGQIPALGLTLARILSARLTRTSSYVIEQIRKGILGRLEMIPPAELIQAMNVSNQTGLLSALTTDLSFSMYFENGQPIDATLGQSSGEEAVYQFMTWHQGSFRFEPGPLERPRSIKVDAMSLLLEGLRRRDEAHGGAPASEPAPPGFFEEPADS